MGERFLYIVFSSTPYRMGRMIRRFTAEPYNHVSISLSADLTPMYSFARRYYRTPFYGGFVRESLSRHHPGGKSSTIRVCRLPVSQANYEKLQHTLADMYTNKERYLYNHLSILTLPFGRLAPVQDAYICAQFCAKMLRMAGYPAPEKRYCSVGELAQQLDTYTVYTGPAPEGEFDREFYAPRPIAHPVRTSAASIVALLPRLRRKE